MTRLIWIPFALSLAACASPTSSCEDGDNSDNCTHDTPDAGVRCGDGTCQASESPQSCPQDCAMAPVDHCNDGTCGPTETPASCPGDCAAKILVTNNSSLTIENIYAWACAASSTTRVDILGNYTLLPNYHIEIDTVNPGCWDYEAISTTNATAYQYNIEMTAMHEFEWTLTN